MPAQRKNVMPPVHAFLLSSHKVMSSGGFTPYTASSMVEKSIVMERLGGTYCLRETIEQKEKERECKRTGSNIVLSTNINKMTEVKQW